MQAPNEIRLLFQDPFAGEKIVVENLPYEEFLRQFEGQHAEWYQGKVILAVPVSLKHQEIHAFLIMLFGFFFNLKPIGRFIHAPFVMDVGDDLPKREPDLMVVLQENVHRIHGSYVKGAADIVVEIVSPESFNRDYATKLQEYEIAGVPEYWLIDPARQIADIYVLGEDKLYHRASLDGQGRLVSTILPGFALDPAIFWQEKLPMGYDLGALVQTMLGIPNK